MGKTKSKKKAKAEPNGTIQTTEGDHHTDSVVSTHAIDGHSVDGWTELQIKAYNDLLQEREKLEKQRKELEQKSARSHAGRALLNENENNFEHAFKQQKPGGAYTFVRSEKCCVEISNAPCSHDVCKRCKTTGISFKELDVIKFYDKRISAETGPKRDRMRGALRSQRDGELLKVIKEDEEERTVSARKLAARSKGALGGTVNDVNTSGRMSGNGFDHEMMPGQNKETQQLVTNILEQLDHLRIDLQAGKISTADMQKQLDNIDAEMQAAQLKPANLQPPPPPAMSHRDIMSSTKAFQDHIKDRIMNTKGDNYSKAFHIMEHFLSASKPGDFQAAVTELKHVLRLSGPMGDELQKSFDALEGIFDSPDRLSFTGPDGKQECSSIIDLMAKMKDTLQRTGKLPEGANSELVSVFEECIKLEADGKNEMIQECHRRLRDGKMDTDPGPALIKIKTDIVAKSPIPPLTEQKLVNEMQTLLYYYDAKRLMIYAKNGKQGSDIEALMTGMVMTRAQKDPEKFVETFSAIVQYYRSLKGQETFKAVDEALPGVERRIQAFVEARAKQKLSFSATLQSDQASLQNRLANHPDDLEESPRELDITDDLPADLHDVVSAAVTKWLKRDTSSNAHLKLREYVLEHGQMGLWPLWLVWTENEKLDEDFELQDKALEFEDASRDTFVLAKSENLKQTIIKLYNLGACPAIAAGVIMQFVSDVADTQPSRIPLLIRELADLIHAVPAPVNKEWSTVFQHLALAIIQLYVGLYVNCQYLFPSISPVHFATATTSMMVSYICLTRSEEGAFDNFKMMWTFLNTCMSPDGMYRVPEFRVVARHFETFSRRDNYRCLSLDKTCLNHMSKNIMAQKRSELLRSIVSGVANGNIQYTSDSSHPGPSRSGQNFPSDTQAYSSGHDDNKSSAAKLASLPKLQITIHYREKLLPEKINRSKGKDVHYREHIKRAAQLYKSTALKALEVMQVNIESPRTSVTQSRDYSRDIMDYMLTLAGVNYYHPVDGGPGHVVSGVAKSKFSEQLDEDDAGDIQGVQHTPKIFKVIEDGRLPNSFLMEYINHIKQDAMSGRWTSPTLAFRRSADKLFKTPNIPEVLKLMLEKAQVEINSSMQTREARQQFTTKRLQCLLWAVRAKCPTQVALYNLALKNHVYFEEYCALLARVRISNGELADDIRELCADALERIGTHRLHHRSKCIVELTRIALSDWADRGEELLTDDEIDEYGSEDSDSVQDFMSAVEDHINDFGASNSIIVADLDGSIPNANTVPPALSSAGSSLSSENTMSFKSAVSHLSTISEADASLAMGQSAEFENADLSDGLSQTDTVTPANLDHMHNGDTKKGKKKVEVQQNLPLDSYTLNRSTANVIDDDDAYYHFNDYDNHADATTLGRHDFAEVEMVMKLRNLDSSFKSMQETRQKLNVLTAHNNQRLPKDQLNAFEKVDQKMQERVELFRDTANMIVEQRDYRTVRGYFRESKE